MAITKKATPAVVSLRSYASHRGVSLSAVQKAIKDGRLVNSIVYVKDVPKIKSIKAADDEWDANTDIGHHSATSGGETAAALQKARVIKEQYAAASAKLEYEEKVGQLVPVNQVKMAAFNASRRARDMLLTIPDRIAPMYPDIAHELHLSLTEEIERVCRELATLKGY